MEAAQLICCIASGFSSRVILLGLAAARHRTAWGQSATAKKHIEPAVDGACGSSTLSVFQTRPLPSGSPLLARTAKGGAAALEKAINPHSPQRSPPGSSTTGNCSNPSVANSSSSIGRARWSQTTSNATGALSSQPRASSGPSSNTRPVVSPSVANKSKHSIKGSSALQPVTFHKKIKSSGYGFVQPKVKMGQPKPTPIKVGLQGNKSPQLLVHQLSSQRQYPLVSIWGGGGGASIELLQLAGSPHIHTHATSIRHHVSR